MTVPSNLIPFRITQLPVDPSPSVTGILMYVRDGVSYQVTADQIVSVTGVPLTRQVNAGTGLTGGGALSSNVTISVAAGGIGTTQLAATGVTPGVYGGATDIPVLTVDATGRVTAATTSPFSITGFVPTTRQVIAGVGLNGGGQLTGNVTLNANLSNATPESVDTTGSSGVSNDISRADHKHPAIDLADDDQVDGLLGLSSGGTARSIVPDEGAVVWSGADGLYLTGVGTPGQVLSSNGTGAPTWLTITGAGTVTSVGGSGGTTGLTVSGGPITAAGTLTLGGTLAISAGGTGLGGTPTNGQLLIGNGTDYTKSVLTAGSNVTITNSTGSITIAATGDVVGPAGATSGAISLFDGGTGKLLKNSVITVNASGVIGNVDTPNTGTDAANKQYVDNIASTGLHYHEAVVLSTSPGSSRTDTYNQPGGAGVGVSATLTAIANGTLVIDGTVASATIRVLIQDCSDPVGNGVYVVTNAGSAGAQYVMTRSSDADTYIEQSAFGLDSGSYFFTTSGTTNKGVAWVNNNSGVIDFGSTAITFAEFSSSQVYSAGNGLSLTATTFSLATPVSVLNGGTGATTQSGARTALGLGTIAVQDANNVNITGGNVSVGSANITTITGTTATFTSATVTNLALTSLTLANLSVTSANITTLTGTTFGTTATTQLRGASGQITNLASTSATITTINSTSGTIANFAATTATISSVVLVGTTVNTNSSSIAATGTISEGVGGVQYLVASQYDVGTNPNQIPLNQYLGSMAFQSSAAISVTDITMFGSLTGTVAGGTY